MIPSIKESREAEIKRAVQEWEARGKPDFFHVYGTDTEIFTIVKIGDDYAVVRCNKIIRLPSGHLVLDGVITPPLPESDYLPLYPTGMVTRRKEKL